MGITLVYPIGTASARHSDILRYSIRSICKFNDVDQVIVIGEEVPWFTGLYIPAKDRWAGDPARNVIAKLHTVVDDSRAPEAFWWMSDDIFQINEWDALPHHTGRLEHTRLTGYFGRMVRHAERMLRGAGVRSPKAYFSHHPLPVRKASLRDMMATHGGSGASYHWPSIYGNLYTDGNARRGPNAKGRAWGGPPKGSSFYSSTPDVEKSGGFLAWLRETCPDPCKFERKEDNA